MNIREQFSKEELTLGPNTLGDGMHMASVILHMKCHTRKTENWWNYFFHCFTVSVKKTKRNNKTNNNAPRSVENAWRARWLPQKHKMCLILKHSTALDIKTDILGWNHTIFFDL